MKSASAILDSLEANLWQALYRCRYDAKHRRATIPKLEKLLRDEDLAIRQRAMRAVTRIGPCDTPGALAKLVPLLCADLEHEDELTRRTALGALFGVGHDAPQVAVPALVRACDDDALLDLALQSLIEIGAPAKSAAPCFRRFAARPQGKIRRLAVRGLGAIGAKDAKSVAILNAALDDPSKSVRDMARKALAALSSRR